jgi:hypothetical protein
MIALLSRVQLLVSNFEPSLFLKSTILICYDTIKNI